MKIILKNKMNIKWVQLTSSRDNSSNVKIYKRKKERKISFKIMQKKKNID